MHFQLSPLISGSTVAINLTIQLRSQNWKRIWRDIDVIPLWNINYSLKSCYYCVGDTNAHTAYPVFL